MKLLGIPFSRIASRVQSKCGDLLEKAYANKPDQGMENLHLKVVAKIDGQDEVKSLQNRLYSTFLNEQSCRSMRLCLFGELHVLPDSSDGLGKLGSFCAAGAVNEAPEPPTAPKPCCKTFVNTGGTKRLHRAHAFRLSLPPLPYPYPGSRGKGANLIEMQKGPGGR